MIINSGIQLNSNVYGQMSKNKRINEGARPGNEATNHSTHQLHAQVNR